MKYSHIIFPLLFIVLSCSQPTPPVLEFPAIIDDGMVLQQNSDIILWGITNPKHKITISTSWGIRKSVKADKSGNWRASLKTNDAGGPYEIAFQTKDTSLIMKDVYLGEVWLCSGQSNMEMPLMGWPPRDTILNSAQEIASANYPLMRFFNVAQNISASPLSDCDGKWIACIPETASQFSAAAYFFGRELHQKLDVPIGLITSTWGGTPVEAWTSGKFLKHIPAYKNIVDSLQIAEIQYDSFLKWMEQLPIKVIDTDDADFYPNLDLGDEVLASIDFDDSNWDIMHVPSFWKQDRLSEFDGVVWHRIKFEVPLSFIDEEMTLQLGPVDDMDVCYINGKKIGEIMELGRWTEERNYTIPVGLLKEGENLLAVRVIDFLGPGGINGPDDIKITNKAGDSLILDSDWKYLPTAEIISNKMYLFSTEYDYSSRPEWNIPMGPHTSTFLYNAMIHPLIPYTIQGSIWYQGEANFDRGFEYRTLFPKMIESWRSAWNQGEFPFYFVQIAPYQYVGETNISAAELREAQTMALSVPNTGMVVTMDIGNPVNIHPANKQDVGKRLALWALAKNYGYDSIVYSGPLYKSIVIEDNKAIIDFNYAESGLVSQGGSLTHFEIAGEDEIFYPAEAIIVGKSVVVTSDAVPVPFSVRYGWSATAEPNLFNRAGLPASPFRTDTWKRLSE